MSRRTAGPIEEPTLALALKVEGARLRRSLAALERAERDLAASQADEGDFNAEPGDIATDLAEDELDLSLAAAQRARLAEVEAALLRLAEGRYGACARCDGAVEPARLRALPWTAYCVRCAATPGAHPPATLPARFAARFE